MVSTRELGKKRYKLLIEANNTGKLAKCKSRFEVAKLVGFNDSTRQKGYLWCSQYISRGKLIEHTIKTQDGSWEHSYELPSQTKPIDHNITKSENQIIIEFDNSKIVIKDFDQDFIKRILDLYFGV